MAMGLIYYPCTGVLRVQVGVRDSGDVDVGNVPYVDEKGQRHRCSTLLAK